MTSDSAPRIAVGVIRKPHGVRGEASVEPWTDSLERFQELEHVTLVSPDGSQLRETTIEDRREHAGRVLLRFAGIHSPEEMAALRGWSIEIPESEARVLDDGEYFLHDLAGLVLVDRAGVSRGVVIEAYEGGGGILLTVKKEDGSKFEVPFAAAICTDIDMKAGRILVSLPEGIDEI